MHIIVHSIIVFSVQRTCATCRSCTFTKCGVSS